MTRSIQLWLLVGHAWHSILTIPVGDFSLFTTRPLRWLQFLGYTIYGRQGILKDSKEGPEIDDYTIGAGELGSHYFYTSQEGSRFIDTQALDDRTSDQWTHSHTSQAEFKRSVVQRDGTCVVSGESAEDCDASHCLPHAKGDEYIEAFTTYRSDNNADIIRDISDVRNGLLVLKQIHVYVGNGKSAFLKTPNFAMDVGDVPPSPRPVPSNSGRLTLQHFAPVNSTIVRRFAPHNQDAQPPADLLTWPPALILDCLYGNAALKKWATDTIIHLIHRQARDEYYTQQAREQEAAEETAARITQQKEAHRDRAVRRHEAAPAAAGEQEEMSGGDMWDVLMFFARQSASQRPLAPNPPLHPDQEDVSRKKVETWLHTQCG